MDGDDWASRAVLQELGGVSANLAPTAEGAGEEICTALGPVCRGHDGLQEGDRPLLAPRSHPQLLHADDAILVVVDMQEPFLRVIHDRERVVKNVCGLLKGAKVLRVPVVSTVQNFQALGDAIPEVKELLPPLLPPFAKMTFNSYSDAGFASEVIRSGRKQVVLCGVESHICISQTALAMLAAGYQVHVCADAVSSRTAENWRIGLDKVRQAGGLVTSMESVLFELLQEAGTADFREILRIVK
jgi:isochorismate hydrolase